MYFILVSIVFVIEICVIGSWIISVIMIWQNVYIYEYLNDHMKFLIRFQLTLADIAFAIYLDRLVDDGIEIHNDSFPKLKQLNENVRSNPKIAEWISKRPVTSF